MFWTISWTTGSERKEPRRGPRLFTVQANDLLVDHRLRATGLLAAERRCRHLLGAEILEDHHVVLRVLLGEAGAGLRGRRGDRRVGRSRDRGRADAVDPRAMPPDVPMAVMAPMRHEDRLADREPEGRVADAADMADA